MRGHGQQRLCHIPRTSVNGRDKRYRRHNWWSVGESRKDGHFEEDKCWEMKVSFSQRLQRGNNIVYLEMSVQAAAVIRQNIRLRAGCVNNWIAAWRFWIEVPDGKDINVFVHWCSTCEGVDRPNSCRQKVTRIIELKNFGVGRQRKLKNCNIEDWNGQDKTVFRLSDKTKNVQTISTSWEWWHYYFSYEHH